MGKPLYQTDPLFPGQVLTFLRMNQMKPHTLAVLAKIHPQTVMRLVKGISQWWTVNTRRRLELTMNAGNICLPFPSSPSHLVDLPTYLLPKDSLQETKNEGREFTGGDHFNVIVFLLAIFVAGFAFGMVFQSSFELPPVWTDPTPTLQEWHTVKKIQVGSFEENLSSEAQGSDSSPAPPYDGMCCRRSVLPYGEYDGSR